MCTLLELRLQENLDIGDSLFTEVMCHCRKYGANRWGGLVRNTIQSVGILPPGRQAEASPFSDMDPETRLDKEEFEKLLAKIDQGLRALPATAQAIFFSLPSSSQILHVQDCLRRRSEKVGRLDG